MRPTSLTLLHPLLSRLSLSSTFLPSPTTPLSTLLYSDVCRLLNLSRILLFLSFFTTLSHSPPGNPTESPCGPFTLIPAAATSTPRRPMSSPLRSLHFIHPPLLCITRPRPIRWNIALKMSLLISFQKIHFLVALSSIFWQEARKYGERALRYCNHDVGHAMVAVVIAAATLGWDVRLLDGLRHCEIKKLLQLQKLYPDVQNLMPDGSVRGLLPWVEAQHPDCVMVIFPFGTEPCIDYLMIRDAAEQSDSWNWVGKLNSLSKDHICWDVIYWIAEAIKKPFSGDKEQLI